MSAHRTIPFYLHSLGPNDGQKMQDVLATPFLTSGAVCRAVEEQLCGFFNVPHALLVNSFTNGAIAALLALGIGPGDEVIVPASTFIASANVVELVGAKPVFADVDPDTLCLDMESVKAALSERTKAIMLVHLYGAYFDVRPFAQLAREKAIYLIEDCAHCFEGSFDGIQPGQLSDLAIFSFYATKNITCGEGGAVICRDKGLYDALSQTRQHGMSAGAINRFKDGGYNHWDMARLGTKANLPDLLAALLPNQIDTVFERREMRQTVAANYRQALEGMGIKMPQWCKGGTHAHHLFPIWVVPTMRDKVIAGLNAQGVNVTVNYHSVPSMQYYKTKGYDAHLYPVSLNWGLGTLSLPLYPSLKEEDQAYVVQALAQAVSAAA